MNVPLIDTSKPFEIEPLTDHLLCELVSSGKTKGGVILTEGAEQEMLPRVRVLKTGPGRWESGKLIECQCKPGDVILLAHPETGAYHHRLPAVAGKSRLLTSEQNVIAKVNGS